MDDHRDDHIEIPIFFSLWKKPGRKIGYERIGPTGEPADFAPFEPNLVFTDNAGCQSTIPRPELDKCIADLKKDDVLLVESMDHLGRNMSELLEIIARITDTGASIYILDIRDGLDPSDGHFISSMKWLEAIHTFERDVAQERRNEGLLKAKKKGVQLGRPTKLSDEQRATIKQRFKDGEKAPALAKEFGVSESLVYLIGREG